MFNLNAIQRVSLIAFTMRNTRVRLPIHLLVKEAQCCKIGGMFKLHIARSYIVVCIYIVWYNKANMTSN